MLTVANFLPLAAPPSVSEGHGRGVCVTGAVPPKTVPNVPVNEA